MKSISLLWKFILAFLLVALTATGLVAAFIRLTSVDRLSRLVVDQQRSSLQSMLVAYYQQYGSWTGVRENWIKLQAASRPFSDPWINPLTSQVGQDGRPAPPPDEVVNRRGLFGLADENGRVLVPVDVEYPAGAQLPKKIVSRGEPVMVDGRQVGTIITGKFAPSFYPEERLFLQRTTDALILAALLAMLVALLIGVFLARNFLRPIRALTGAAQNMARGSLDQQVSVTTGDEIGQLARAFNSMSLEIARVNRQRKQMTADIAHDLRTPLTVIAGYVESMRDGVLKPTTERLSLIYTEIDRLQRLVDDLKMLSQADAGELPLMPQRVQVGQLLEHAAAPFRDRAAQRQVSLEVSPPAESLEVQVDEARMMQVFANLIANALRYTPPGGRIILAGQARAGRVEISVTDNGEGIAAQELPLIFDRFHRADPSRHADNGESGLGLAIVRALVEAHGGTVRAESSPGQGTAILIDLPG